MANKGKIVPFERDGGFYSKLGLKMVAEKKFPEAKELFERAIMVDRENCKNYFNLAGVMSEMGNIRESISILESAIKNRENVVPDCYFALGCNYFDLGDHEKSRKQFEKYSEVAPRGTFIMEAIEAIRFIDSNILNKKKNVDERIQKLASKGKEYLERYEFDKAIRALKTVNELDKEAINPRNNLSLAYYLNDDVSEAISVAREVIKLDKENPYANCNLAMFYKTIDSEDMYIRQLHYVKKARYESVEEILSAIDILYKLNEDYVIRHILERMIKEHDEIILWHFFAIAYHNTNKLGKAIDTWGYIREKLPHMTIFTDCFTMETTKSIETPNRHKKLDYDVKVYTDYMARIEELIETLLKVSEAEFVKTWGENQFVKMVVEYGLYRLDKGRKIMLVEKMACVEDDSALKILNLYIKTSSRRDEVSNKCEEVIMRRKVAGDSLVNVIKFGK